MENQTPHSPRPFPFEPLLYSIVSFLALLPGLNRGLILDEYKTRMVAALSWESLLKDRLASGHLPTYFGFMKVWTSVFGEGEMALRFPGVILTALATPFLYLFVRRISSVRAARIAALLFAFHQQVSWIGQTARPYSGVLLCEFLLFYAAAEWWHSRRARWLCLAGIAALAGIAFMPLSGLVPLSLILGTLTLLKKQPRSALLLIASQVAAIAVGLLPALLLASSQTRLSTHHGLNFPDFPKMFEGICNMVYGDYELWARGFMQYVAALVLVLAVVAVWRPSQANLDTASGSPVPWRMWLLCWILIPMFILTIATAITGESMVSHLRYRTPALGGIIVLLALALDHLLGCRWRAGIRYSLAALLVLPMLITTVAWWRAPGEGLREVVAEVLSAEHGIPDQVAGHGRWFRLGIPDGQAPRRELFLERAATGRNDEFIESAKVTGSAVQVMKYEKDSDQIEPVRKKLESWAEGNPFWLFVYIQRKDALDQVAKHPPAGFKLDNTFRFQDTRAYHFTPE